MKARDITNFLHSRPATMVAMVAAAVCAFVAWQRGAVVPVDGNLGVGFPSVNLYISSRFTSAVVNLCLTFVVAVAMVYLNRVYNILRSLTSLVATLFVVMQAAEPSVMGQFYGGTVLAVLFLVCTALLFSIYDERTGPARCNVFLIFFLFSAAAFTQVGYLFFLPALLLGTAQMRIFSLRTFLAALLGAVTPAWILFGLEIVTVDNLQWPGMAFNMMHLFGDSSLMPDFVAVGFTVLLAVGFTAGNLMKFLSYNARTRALNGFLTMMLAATVLLTLLNFANFMFYQPLLNILTAYQISHFFACRRSNRSYIPILLIIACFIALYVWAVSAAEL